MSPKESAIWQVVGRDGLTNDGVCQGNDHTCNENSNGDCKKTAHGTESQVLLVLLLEHLEGNGNGENNRCTRHVTRDHRHNP